MAIDLPPAHASLPLPNLPPDREDRQEIAPLAVRDLATTHLAPVIPQANYAAGSAAPPRNWLEGWLFPFSADARKSPRQPAPGLTARIWMNGASLPLRVRDISASGVYVETEERWYPGTLIRMTLSKPSIGHEPAECSVSLQARIVRWGDDGVGLEFVFDAPRGKHHSGSSVLEYVSNQELDRFLDRLRAGSRSGALAPPKS